MKNKINIIITFIVCMLCIQLKAQNDCKNAIYEANKFFEAGQIRECIEKLEPCIPSITDKEELTESYHLLAQAYQNINNVEKANYYVKKMLLLKPDYKKYPNIDPIDFSNLVKQFDVSPRLYLGLKFGYNITSIKLVKSYSTYASPQSYNPATGYQFGLAADYRVWRGFSINSDFLLCGLKINHIVDSAGGEKQEYNEQQNYGMLNLSFQKHIAIKEVLFLHAGLGIGLGYLYRANIDLESTTLKTQSLRQVSKDPIEERNKFQPSLLFMGGAGFPVSKGILSVDVSYNYFFNTTVKSSARMNDLDFIFNNQYVNDDISLRTMMVSLTYKFPLLWRIQSAK